MVVISRIYQIRGVFDIPFGLFLTHSRYADFFASVVSDGEN